MEYNSWEFLKWFLKNPLKRNLQKKHHLYFSNKALAILVGTVILETIVAIILNIKPDHSAIFFILSLILLQPLTPFFLILADLFYKPLEIYLKNNILEDAKQKLENLPYLKIAAITGSFGKTSTKDILYTLLWKKYYVVKTPKSFNTRQGIAQTVLELVKENTDIFICEMGAYKKGEIKKICDFIKPDIGIVTAIAPQHLERFGSIESIVKAKFELPQSLKKDGIAILNSTYAQIKDNSSSVNAKVIFYGSEGDPFYATNIKTNIEETSFTIHTPEGKTKINIPLVGEHHVANFLAASAVALQLGLTLSEIRERARLLLPTPHRMQIKKVGNMTFIDNSYNTNPKSAESSLNLLASFKKNRKIVITPGFVELGNEASRANQDFGNSIKCIADEVIIVGENAKKDLLEGMKAITPHPEDEVHFASSTKEAIQLAQRLTMGVETVVLLENDLPDQYS